MKNTYEVLFAEVFTRRTVMAMGLATGWAHTVLIMLYIVGGRLVWPKWNVDFSTLPFFIAQSALVLSLLVPIAKPNGINVKLWKRGDFIGLLLWMATSGAFLHVYFRRFAPLYLTMYSYPEGKYGPPLLREQPFFIASFAIVLGIVSFFRMAWKFEPVNYHLDGIPPLMKLIKERYQHILRRSAKTLLLSLSLLAGESLFVPPHTYTLYSYMIMWGSIRRVSHSFYEFLDIRLLYHLLWSGASLLAIYEGVDFIVECEFGECFHIIRSSTKSNSNPLSSNPTRLLLEGLRSTKMAVKNHAIMELVYLLFNENGWRETMFSEFIEDEPVSKIISVFFIEQLTNYKNHIHSLNEDLKRYSKRLEKYHEQQQGSSSSIPADRSSSATNDGTISAREAKIFSPRKRNIFEKIIDPIIERSKSIENLTKKTLPNETSYQQRRTEIGVVPDVLEIKTKEGRQLPSLPLLSSGGMAADKNQPMAGKKPDEEAIENRYILITAIIFGPIITWYPGRVYSALACEMIKAWWLGNENPILWLIDALAAFIVASFDEDIHGQVQFMMNDLLLCMIELYEEMMVFESLPKWGGQQRKMIADLFSGTLSPTDRRCRAISNSIAGSTEVIMEKFADSWAQLRLEPMTREKLAAIPFV